MSKYVKEIEHELRVPFKYHKDGALAEARKLTISAPTNKQIKDTSKLEREQAMAIIAVADKFKSVESRPEAQAPIADSDETALQLMHALAGGGANMNECYDAFKNILCASAVVDGSVQVTSAIFDSMSPVDTKIALGKYLSSFLSFSLAD